MRHNDIFFQDLFLSECIADDDTDDLIYCLYRLGRNIVFGDLPDQMEEIKKSGCFKMLMQCFSHQNTKEAEHALKGVRWYAKQVKKQASQAVDFLKSMVILLPPDKEHDCSFSFAPDEIRLEEIKESKWDDEKKIDLACRALGNLTELTCLATTLRVIKDEVPCGRVKNNINKMHEEINNRLLVVMCGVNIPYYRLTPLNRMRQEIHTCLSAPFQSLPWWKKWVEVDPDTLKAFTLWRYLKDDDFPEDEVNRYQREMQLVRNTDHDLASRIQADKHLQSAMFVSVFMLNALGCF